MSSPSAPTLQDSITSHLGPADLQAVETMVAATLRLFSRLHSAAPLSPAFFKTDVAIAINAFRDSTVREDLTPTTDQLRAHLVSVVREATKSVGLDIASGKWNLGTRSQKLQPIYTVGTDRPDLVEILSTFVLYPKALKTLNYLQGVGRGMRARLFSELTEIGDAITLFHSLDPNLLLAQPGIDALAAKYLARNYNGPAEFDLVIREVCEYLEHLAKVQSAFL
jgi:hypothetical protein